MVSRPERPSVMRTIIVRALSGTECLTKSSALIAVSMARVMLATFAGLETLATSAEWFSSKKDMRSSLVSFVHWKASLGHFQSY